jgi:hypothetical protein
VNQLQAGGRLRHGLLHQQRLRCDRLVDVVALAIHEMDGSQEILRFHTKLGATETPPVRNTNEKCASEIYGAAMQEGDNAMPRFRVGSDP